MIPTPGTLGCPLISLVSLSHQYSVGYVGHDVAAHVPQSRTMFQLSPSLCILPLLAARSGGNNCNQRGGRSWADSVARESSVAAARTDHHTCPALGYQPSGHHSCQAEAVSSYHQPALKCPNYNMTTTYLYGCWICQKTETQCLYYTLHNRMYQNHREYLEKYFQKEMKLN